MKINDNDETMNEYEQRWRQQSKWNHKTNPSNSWYTFWLEMAHEIKYFHFYDAMNISEEYPQLIELQ